jgi:hemerythrin superfamily protein
MTQAKKGGQHATTLLTEDHKAVKKLFKEFEKSEQDNQKDQLVKQICMELSVHAQIEEEIFYPAAREAIKDQDLLDEAEEEHGGIKGVVEELKGMQPGDEHYEAKVKVLSEYVEHHVQEEQDELFPKVKKADIDTPDLGAQLLERKQELMDNPALLEEAAAAAGSSPPKARPSPAAPR